MLLFWSLLACQREPRESEGGQQPSLSWRFPPCFWAGPLYRVLSSIFSQLPCASPNLSKVSPKRTSRYFAWKNLHIIGKKYFAFHIQPFGFLCLDTENLALQLGRHFAKQTAAFPFCQLQMKKPDSIYDESKERVWGTVIRVTLTVSSMYWTFTIYQAPYKPFTYIILFDPYNGVRIIRIIISLAQVGKRSLPEVL